MNLRKFISSVSAVAIAASTFAAMAVTASATDYSESLTIGASDAYNMASYSSGTATAKALSSGQYAAIRKDFSSLTDIDKATSVTVEFDTAVASGTVALFGFGDASTRTQVANGSGAYKLDGLAICFGSDNGSNYRACDVKTSSYLPIGSTAFSKVVHARITFNKAAGTYDYWIGYSDSANIKGTGQATDIGNLTYVDAYTNTSGGAFRFNNLTVSYTVPDAPAPESYSFDLAEAEAVTGTDGNAVVIKNTVTGITEIDTITVVAEGNTKEFESGVDFDSPTISGDTVIGIVVKGVSSVTSITIN